VLITTLCRVYVVCVYLRKRTLTEPDILTFGYSGNDGQLTGDRQEGWVVVLDWVASLLDDDG
jgi:hypothetical protein